MEFYTKNARDALDAFQSDAHAGLSDAKMRENGEKYGKNEVTKEKRKSLLRRIWEASTEPMLILLLFAWAITIAVNIVNVTQGEHFDWAECVGILVAVLISVVLTVVMEGRSAKAFEELNKIKEGVEIKVVRGGVVQYVPQHELVAGDIVFLETGNKVAADGRLLECTDLYADESSLSARTWCIRARSSPAVRSKWWSRAWAIPRSSASSPARFRAAKAGRPPCRKRWAGLARRSPSSARCARG